MTEKSPTPARSSEHEKVSREQKHDAMRELREDARKDGIEEQRARRQGEPGQWPGKELTRNTIPNADDDPERDALPDDIQRDISQDGVTHDPADTVERAP